jgi:hypothetical protein
MSSLPQVAAALEQVVTEVATEAAGPVGFVRRQRVLTGALFVQALVLGWLAQPEATLHQLTQALAVRGAAITPQGLAKRFGPEAAALLERVLAAAVGAAIATTGVEADLLTRFAGVYVLDCTTIRLPDALAPVWRGGGGRTAQGTASALKAQVRLELVSGRLEGPALLAGRTHDKAGPWHAASLPKDALLLADLGYWSLERFRALGAAGAFWLSRLDPQTHVFDATGARLELPRWLARQDGGAIAAAVVLGGAAHLPARLLAAPVPPAVAADRRRRLRARAKRKGVQPAKATLAVADWTIVVTNVPAARLSVAEAMALARARWPIELLFKLWKQHGGLAASRSAHPWRVLTEVYAKLTGLVIQHWLLLLGGWTRLDRSLVRLAQTVRAHAGSLLRALGRPRRLREELTVLIRCLGVGGRVAKRKIKPSAFQLWRDPALLGLS